MLEINSIKTLKIKIFGVEYEIKKPTLKQIEEYQLKIKDDESKSIEIMLSFFESLGLPRDVVKELDVDSISELAAAVNGAKKN